MLGFLFRKWISPFNSYLPQKSSKEDLDDLREKGIEGSIRRVSKEKELVQGVEYFEKEEASYKQRIELESEQDKLKLRRKKEKANIDFVENASAYLLLEKKKKEAKRKNKKSLNDGIEKKKKKQVKKPSPFLP